MPLTQVELERRLIYAIVVSGKAASFADKACLAFWRLLGGPTPFQFMAGLSYRDILDLCIAARLGAYRKNAKAFHDLSRSLPDLRTCLPADLEKFHGIGKKTSRFFITWTRPEARYAVLDVHILRWMAQHGIWTPARTPRHNDYQRLERVFLQEADRLGLTPRQLDWKIWQEGSKYKGDIQSGPRSFEETERPGIRE
jgi:hypothetical protein